MNGDAQTILNKIIEIETKQEERHTENKQDFNILFKKVSKLDDLPCPVHTERMKWMWWAVCTLYGVIFLIVGALIRNALAH